MNAQIYTAGDLRSSSLSDLIRLPGVGDKTLLVLSRALDRIGLSWDIRGILERRASPTKRVVVELNGRQFGRLTVIGRDQGSASSSQGRKWVCRCSCGTAKLVSASSLLSGATKSCGCLASERRGISAINYDVMAEEHAHAVAIIKEIVDQWEGADWCQDAVMFLHRRRESAKSVNAVDPSATNPGKPPTRAKS